MMRLLMLLSLAFSSFAAQALTMNEIQGRWWRFGVRCDAASEVWDVRSNVIMDVFQNTLLSRSEVGFGVFAETEATINPMPVGSTLEFTFENVISRPYPFNGSLYYDFLDSKVGMPLAFELEVSRRGTKVLILRGDVDTGRANGCGGPLEFLYRQ